MTKEMQKISASLILFICIIAGLSILLMAYAHHGVADPIAKERLLNAATICLPNALLGLICLNSKDKMGRSAFLSIIFITLGFFLFVLPVSLLGLNIIERTPSAPFGGISFVIAWIIAGFGAFKGSLRQE